MARHIDADILTEEIMSLKISLSGKDIFQDRAKESVLRIIDEQPTADVKEVKRGHWKHTVEFGIIGKYNHWNCSLCGAGSEDEGREKFCHECGADMRGEEDGNL